MTVEAALTERLYSENFEIDTTPRIGFSVQ